MMDSIDVTHPHCSFVIEAVAMDNRNPYRLNVREGLPLCGEGNSRNRETKGAVFPFTLGASLPVSGRDLGLALLEVLLILVTTRQRFRLELAPSQDIRLRLFSALSPCYGLKVTVHSMPGHLFTGHVFS